MAYKKSLRASADLHGAGLNSVSLRLGVYIIRHPHIRRTVFCIYDHFTTDK